MTSGGALPTLDMMLEIIRRRQGYSLALEVSRLFIYEHERTGGLLQVLAARGYPRAEGLDPDPAAVMQARQKGLRVSEGLASQAPARYAGRQFDLIVLSHVAEHLRDLDWLRGLPALLAPGGALYIEIPDPRGYRCEPRPPAPPPRFRSRSP